MVQRREKLRANWTWVSLMYLGSPNLGEGESEIQFWGRCENQRQVDVKQENGFIVALSSNWDLESKIQMGRNTSFSIAGSFCAKWFRDARFSGATRNRSCLTNCHSIDSILQVLSAIHDLRQLPCHFCYFFEHPHMMQYNVKHAQLVKGQLVSEQ